MGKLIELAERCEQATEPDRELSAEIALAVHDWLSVVEGNKPLNCRVRNSYGSPVYIGGVSSNMDYTAFLDAAMTLVPEGWNWGAYYNPENATLYPNAVGSAKCQGPVAGDFEHSQAATPALALCAAALRARTQNTPELKERKR